MTKNAATVNDLCESWKQRFQEHNITEPESSAKLIIAHSMGLKTVSNLYHITDNKVYYQNMTAEPLSECGPESRTFWYLLVM